MSQALLSQLNQLPLDRKVSIRGEEAWLCCPFHNSGMETTPSLKITLYGEFSDRYFCFACRKAGHFNEIAEIYKLEGIDSKFSSKDNVSFSFRHLTAYESEVSIDESKTFKWNDKYDWRGIPGWLMRKAKARVNKTSHPLVPPRVIFPVLVYDEKLGEVTATLNAPKRDSSGKKTEMSYVNSSGSWKNSSLFGHHLANLKRFQNKNLWIAEGPRDVLHLLASNCRAVGLLGSSCSEDQCELIRMLNPKKILVATDADEAGENAAESISDGLSDDFPLVRIRWKEGTDPCDYNSEYLRRIDRRYQ